VLYLALEDSERRLQRRLRKLLPAFNAEWPEKLELATKWKRLHEGGADALRGWCRSREKPTLIAIDTLALIRPPPKSSQQAYQADYDAMTFLRELATEIPGLGIVIVHHDRKMEAVDVFDTVSGTQGLIGAADTICIIKRNATGTTLHVRGRDVEESEKAIEFDRSTCRWTILGPAAEVHRSNERGRVIAALQAAGEPLCVSEIMASAQLRNRNAADLLLSKMARDGEVARVHRGSYSIPAETRQIGQTERFGTQAAEITAGSANLSNLSDLSGLSTQDEFHACSASKDPWKDLDIPQALRRWKLDS
jgi:AAA domain